MLSGVCSRCGYGAQSQLLQFNLHRMVARSFGVNLGHLVVLQFQRRRDHFPTTLATMNFKSVLDEPSVLRFGARQRHEDPLITFQSMERFHFAMRNPDAMGMVIDGLDPRLFAHGLPSIVQKTSQLFRADDGPHPLFLARQGPREKRKHVKIGFLPGVA